MNRKRTNGVPCGRFEPLGGIETLTALLALALMSASTALTAPVAAQDAPASLTVNVYTCGPLNDPIDPNETLINECDHGTEDIPFTLAALAPQGSSAMASTGTGGHPATIAFSQLTPGDYRLTQEPQSGVKLSYITVCTSDARTFTYPFRPFAIIEPEGRLNLGLLPGENLTCDWYNVQSDDPSSTTALTVTVYDCSGDVLDPAVCDPAPGIDLLLRPVGPGNAQLVNTGPDGIATFYGTGTFSLDVLSNLEDRDVCAIEPADPRPAGELTLDRSNPVAIEIYYCDSAA